MTNNQRLKLIKGALELTRADVANAVTHGGITTSASRADAWLRSESAKKHGTGGSASGSIQQRARNMTDAEFDAFCIGLKPVIDALQPPTEPSE